MRRDLVELLLSLAIGIATLAASVWAFGRVLVFLRDRWRVGSVPVYVEPEPEPITTEDRTCILCAERATRYAPAIVEHRGLVSLLRPILPLEVIPPRYRRGQNVRALVFCELHGSIADRELDHFLSREQLELSAYLRDRAARAARFERLELLELLEQTRAPHPWEPDAPRLSRARLHSRDVA